MSIWVRLIGGPSNGQVQKIDDDQSQIIMRERLPEPIVHSHRNFGLAGATATYKEARYTRREVRRPGGDITYFAEEKLSDHEALQLVLGP